MKKILTSITLTLCVYLISSILFVNQLNATGIQFITAEEPPLQYHEDGKIKGISWEIIQLMFKDLGVETPEIKFYPWSRAYKLAQEEKNIFFFSVGRMEARESLFKWVGTLYSLNSYLFKAKSNSDIVINTLEDARKYRIALKKDDARAIYLKSKGFKPSSLVTDNIQAIGMMMLGRIDLLAEAPLIVKHVAKEQNMDYDKLTPVYKIMSTPICIAFSKTTDDVIVEKYVKALQRVKQTKDYADILKKYDAHELLSE